MSLWKKCYITPNKVVRLPEVAIRAIWERYISQNCNGNAFYFYTSITFTLESAEKCSCTSRQRSRDEVEELPEAVANILLEIMENCQTEVTNGEKKPLQKRWQCGDSECKLRQVEINLPNFGTSTAMLLEWLNARRGEETFWSQSITRWRLAVISQLCFIKVSEISLEFSYKSITETRLLSEGK